MYKVIKEFAGVKVGTEMPIRKDQVKYMIEAGYIEPIEPEVKSRKKKIDKTKIETK
jgi:hypothetical protein